MKVITVLGAGGWGTALAIHLRNRGYTVRLWGRTGGYMEQLTESRENAKYLPAIKIPPEVRILTDVVQALEGIDLAVEAVPIQFVRPTLRHIRPAYPAGIPMISCSKGIENHTLLRGTEIIRDVLGGIPAGALSGPSHCEEVVRGRPTGVVVASTDPRLSKQVQAVFNGHTFRVYTNSDLIGVELAGAVKNVIAISAGICDGLGYGDNSKAALVARGLAEIVRLGRALGAKPQTFYGLAGVGDLYTTCVSQFGRNRGVGERIGRGERLDEIRASMSQVAEGIDTARSVRDLARRHNVEMPICEEVYKVLFQRKSPAKAVQDLMAREPGDENE
jgi:glycerol-3-phosphate dehydrogenase (NAD(P)+)